MLPVWLLVMILTVMYRRQTIHYVTVSMATVVDVGRYCSVRFWLVSVLGTTSRPTSGSWTIYQASDTHTHTNARTWCPHV